MSAALVISALALPPESRVDQRVPKKLLLEQTNVTPVDKRQLQDGIEDLNWIAALKPTNVGVPAYRDDVREYLEIAVLSATLRSSAKIARITELIHRAIAYPLFLITDQAGGVCLSLAHKRWSQGETGKVVIEDLRSTANFRPDAPKPEESLFLISLAISTLSNSNLFTLYQGWLDRVNSLKAAQITGQFAPPKSANHSLVLRDGLTAHAQLQRDISSLRAQAAREKQLNRRVELNLELKRLEAELAAVSQSLKEETL